MISKVEAKISDSDRRKIAFRAAVKIYTDSIDAFFAKFLSDLDNVEHGGLLAGVLQTFHLSHLELQKRCLSEKISRQQAESQASDITKMQMYLWLRHLGRDPDSRPEFAEQRKRYNQQLRLEKLHRQVTQVVESSSSGASRLFPPVTGYAVEAEPVTTPSSVHGGKHDSEPESTSPRGVQLREAAHTSQLSASDTTSLLDNVPVSATQSTATSKLGGNEQADRATIARAPEPP
eukprot:TRINITY_DN30166_c0_g1_i1.p1 TRINITY_DN30166_c0_g1~~TRINITY_DN30166_c0_g1_i1.p1  ORF type:complete len:233 (+),score=14.56 TRINITY_DN30166_c0_g1_i1:3-701(+)